MAQRMAATMSLVVFMVCLLAGTNAGNPFITVIGRALAAMTVTMVIGLIVGAMAQKMLDENIKKEEEKLKNDAVRASQDGR